MDSEDVEVDRLIQRLKGRRLDSTGQPRFIREALSKSLANTPAKARAYLEESMSPVPGEYTQATLNESKRIEAQLAKRLREAGFEVEFANQGSTTSNTHIMIHSDIDILVCTNRFHYLVAPRKPDHPYQGDPVAHLKGLRTACELALASAYPAATVDPEGAKAVSVSGGSLRRKVDVVAGSWIHTEAFLLSGQALDRGVKILDKDESALLENFPFLHNRLIDARDAQCGGNLRRAIRFLKSLKADSELTPHVSSYDICGICFSFSIDKLASASSELDLAAHVAVLLHDLTTSESARSTLRVPIGTRTLFANPNDAELLVSLKVLSALAAKITLLARRAVL